MMFEPFPAFLPPDLHVKAADSAWEREGAASLRRQVFCAEQHLFDSDDRDAIDDVAMPLVAVSSFAVADDAVVGTVRIHEAEPGLWWGSRLAVARSYRGVGAVGSALIRLAVGSARARGCTRFLAHVQAQNAPLFERLHWRVLGDVTLHGHPHCLMQPELDRYAQIIHPEAGFVARLKHAA